MITLLNKLIAVYKMDDSDCGYVLLLLSYYKITQLEQMVPLY